MGSRGQCGGTEPDSESSSYPLPNFMGEDVQFVCVFILKVPSYFKKII